MAVALSYALTTWGQLHAPEDLPFERDPKLAAFVWTFGLGDRIDTGRQTVDLPSYSQATLRRAVKTGWLEEMHT